MLAIKNTCCYISRHSLLLTHYIALLALLQRLAAHCPTHVFSEQRLAPQVRADVSVDVLGRVGQHVPQPGVAGRPVQAALLGIRLLGVIKVQVRGVRQDHLGDVMIR